MGQVMLQVDRETLGICIVVYYGESCTTSSNCIIGMFICPLRHYVSARMRYMSESPMFWHVSHHVTVDLIYSNEAPQDVGTAYSTVWHLHIITICMCFRDREREREKERER